MGYFGFGTVLAPALGPSVGGLLVEWFGWRAIFFFVLPFCVVALEMAHRVMPHSAPGAWWLGLTGFADAVGFAYQQEGHLFY